MGVLLLLIGLGVLGFGLAQHLKGKRILAAPFRKTGEAAASPSPDPKGAMSTEGAVVAGQPLLSPCTKTPCLYYEVEIRRKWEKQEQTQDGLKTKSGSDKVTTVQQGMQFALDDGTGPVSVDLAKGADFDNLKKNFDKEVKMGMFVPGELQFGEMRMQTPVLPGGERTTAFVAEEKIVPVGGNLFVLGKLENGGLIKPSWRSMLVSSKGRDGLLAATNKRKKVGFISGGVAAVLSIPLMIWGPSGDGDTSHCKSQLSGVQASCKANVDSSSGDQYTWKVETAGEYTLAVTPPAGKKFPLDPQLVVKSLGGEVALDASADSPGSPAVGKSHFEPGTYTVVVKDLTGTQVKGGFDYSLEIKSDAVVAAGAAQKGGSGKSYKAEKLGLVFEVDPDVEVGEALEVMDSYTFPCCGGGAIQLSPVKADNLSAAKSLDEAKSQAKMFDQSQVTKADTTTDGWRVEYHHESGMGPMYKVQVRRTVDGRKFDCEASGDSDEKAQVAAKACTTLKGTGGSGAPAAVAAGEKPLELDAPLFVAEYLKGPDQAEARFLGRTVQLKGLVASAKADAVNGKLLKLDTALKYTVTAELGDDANLKGLKKGSVVIVRGIVQNASGNEIPLANAVIVAPVGKSVAAAGNSGAQKKLNGKKK